MFNQHKTKHYKDVLKSSQFDLIPDSNLESLLGRTEKHSTAALMFKMSLIF